MRNIFAQGLPWADELARFFGIALVFIGAPHLARQGQHIAVDLFQALLPKLARRVALWLVKLTMLTFSGVMV
ncbi:TRAP transporter small permease [Roseinatronobacter sp. S2]|uniref:TRAP transporter small permease n=1 Tax=Roseinatronobacter sp. S2 TaxID=3035471 RepID=UPI00358FCCDF